MSRTIGLLLVVLGTAVAAEAQTQRGVARAFGGVTFMSETAGVVGVSVGAQVAPQVEVFVEAGHLTNALPHSLQRDLDQAARSFGTLFGGPLHIDGRAPAVYAFGAVRFNRRAGARTRLYVDGGGGVVHGWSDIRAHASGVDVSTSVVAALGVKESENAGLFTVGAGLILELRPRLGLEAGYRFMRIFTDDPRINTANLSAGLRWGF